MIQDLSTRKRIGSGHERGDIYYLDDRVNPTGLVISQPDPVLLRHWHLGHPSVQKIRSVIPIESSISSLGCESCELNKHHHATFQSRVNSRNSSAFKLVQSDVWCPSRVPSIKDLNILCFLLISSFAYLVASPKREV